jgi:uncharacterized protein YdhG (YjbR/CyaY superfamily)
MTRVTTFTSVDDYVASCPDDVQEILSRIRATVRSVLPDAEERISYQMPTITLDGRALVHFAAWKHHIGLYPLPEVDHELQAELAPYETGKGTARFPLNRPVPYDLIEKLVTRLADQRGLGATDGA